MMKRLYNEEIVSSTIGEMDYLLSFYRNASVDGRHSIHSEARFEDDVMFRFVLDGKGSRVEIGSCLDGSNPKVMFVGKEKGGVVVYSEVEAERRPDWPPRRYIRGLLLDIYGCVGMVSNGEGGY